MKGFRGAWIVAIAAVLALAAMPAAHAQTAGVTVRLTGTLPGQEPYANTIQGSSCVNAGVSSLPVGYAMPLPCNSSGQLVTSGSGGGGGAVTAASGAFVNGSIVELGNTTDTPCAAYNTAACTANQLERLIAEQVGASIPAGTNVIGGVTQSGTWTVTVTQPTAANLNAAVVGTGTAGSPAGNVLTTQPPAAGQVAISIAPTTAGNTAQVVDLRPDSPGIITLGPASTANSVPMVLSSQLPGNATAMAVQVTASAAGTTAATTATLAGTSGKTTYICGWQIDAYATTATAVTYTVTGLLGGTMTFIQSVGTTTTGVIHTPSPPLAPCLPASAANTAITVVSGAAGTGGVVEVNAWGFQL